MMAKFTALVVEDEEDVLLAMSRILTANRFKVLKAEKAYDACMMIESHCPDIIILDLGLPDMDGKTVIESVRQWSEIPIIVSSARACEKDIVEALDAGADDYITKPYRMGELLARVRVALRHSAKGLIRNDRYMIYHAGGLNIDFGKRCITLYGRDVHLTQNEFKILSVLAKNAGIIQTYDSLIRDVWGPNMDMDNQILRVNIANIRRKIEDEALEPKYIFTEIGVGYRMLENEIDLE